MSRLALCVLAALLLLAVPFSAPAQGIITTIAGTTWIFRGDGGLALDAPLGSVYGLVLDSAGNVFATDVSNNMVVKITPAGVLNVVAGNGIRGYSGDGGPATSASLFAPYAVAVDSAGNIYIADRTNHRIRRISTAGTITTVAGDGYRDRVTRLGRFAGDGGPATSASLNYASGVALDGAGNLLIADTENHRIRKVAGGTITTIAGTGTRGFAGDGGPATSAQLSSPYGLRVDGTGNIYFVDRNNRRIRKISPTGTITTVAGGGNNNPGDDGPALSAFLTSPVDVSVDAAGNLLIVDLLRVRKVSAGGTITTVAGTGTGGFSGDGGPATAALVNSAQGVVWDGTGGFYLTDTGNLRIRKVSAAGVISTIAGSGSYKFAGDGGPAGSASLSFPYGLALDASGNLYIGDVGNRRIRKVSSSGIITTVAGNGIAGYSGDLVLATRTSLSVPYGVAVDAAGNLYIADTSNYRVRKVGPNGVIATVAGTGTFGFSGDGGYATAAMLRSPYGVAADAAGNFYIADTSNYRIRKVDSSGIITTIAGTGRAAAFSGDGGPAKNADLNFPQGVALDAAGNLYIADTNNFRVRKVSLDGNITTVAGNGTSGFSGDGGPATSASLGRPWGLAVDGTGNLYIADQLNHRIRKVTTAGIISTVAGDGFTDSEGLTRFAGDGGPATAASLAAPGGVAVDAQGNLYIADAGNGRIRLVSSALPSFEARPGSLSFAAPSGSPAGTPAQITISSIVAGLAWQAVARTSSGGNWLSLSASSGQMPASTSVSADATNLAAGTYQGTIEITSPAALPSLRTVAVTFTVSAPQSPSLAASPLSLSFQAAAESTVPAQSLRIENAGGGALDWTVQASAVGGKWLSVSPASGSGLSRTPAIVQVSVNTEGLAIGSYSGSVTVSSATTNQKITIPVNLLVSAPVGVLLLSQNSLVFRAIEGGGAEPAQTFGVLNVGSGSLNWTATTTTPWLRISPGSGRGDSATTQIPLVTVSVEPGSLSAGFYVGLIPVASTFANNSPQLVRVELHVLPRGTRLGAIVRPTGLIFVAVAGGSSPSSQDVSVGSTEETAIEFLSQPIGGDWVTRVPESGSAARGNPGRIIVQPDVENLASGVYRAALTVFTTNDGEVHPVRLLFLVLPAGTATTAAFSEDGVAGPAGTGLACTSSQLFLQFASLFTTFNATVGWPTTVLVNARDNCGSPAAGGTVALSFSSGDAALALVDLKNGQYQGVWRPNSAANPQVVVTARGFWKGLQGETTSTAQIGLNPNPQGAILGQGGVLLGAGFERGPVAPGSIISLFGQNLASGVNYASSLPLPRTLGGAKVLIGGKEAPLFYAGPGQVNAQVPPDLGVDRQLQVMVETNGVPSAPEPLQTASNRPGIFTLGGTYGNQGAILIANTANLAMPVTAGIPSEPVSIGGYISIFCTGLGATEPAVASGDPGPSDPPALVKTTVTVTIGGQAANVTFAGLAPGFVGVYQVNAQVPAGVTTGDAVPVVMTQGSFQSNTANIAVK